MAIGDRAAPAASSGMYAQPAAVDPHAATGFAKESDVTDFKEVTGVHGGKGTIRIRRFGFAGAALPTNFVQFEIPPQASEGVHVHGIGLPTGPYDEYYYIGGGSGVMLVDGKEVPVKAGDHVHVPMGIHHGIENTAREGNMRLLITFITKTA